MLVYRGPESTCLHTYESLIFSTDDACFGGYVDKPPIEFFVAAVDVLRAPTTFKANLNFMSGGCSSPALIKAPVEQDMCDNGYTDLLTIQFKASVMLP